MINQTEEAFNELVALYSQNIMQQIETINKIQTEPLYELLPEDEAAFRIGYEAKILDHKQSLDDYAILLVCERDSLGLPELDHLIFEQAQHLELSIQEIVEYRDIFGYNPVDERKLFCLDGHLEFGESPPTSISLLEATFEMLEASLADNDRQFLNDNPSERNLLLAQDCREIVNSQGVNQDDRITSFQRADGQGKYIITLDRQSDTLFLHSNSHSDLFPNDLILVESKSKILHSKVIDLNADQIHQAVLLLNAEKSKPIEITHEKETLTR